MNLQIKLVLISFMASIMIALIILPILKRLKIGQIEREYGPRTHLIKQGTPTMGGIIIAITLIIGAIVLYTSNKDTLPLALAIIGFGLIGFIDDFKKLILRDTKGLKPSYKMTRIIINFGSIFSIFNKNENRNRHNNPNIKNRIHFTTIYLYTIYDTSNACCNKCSKLN